MQKRAADRLPRRERELRRELLPLAPFLYLAWADGALSDGELAELRERASTTPTLGDEDRAALRAWLDPANPPTAAELARLLELVHTFGTASGDPGDLRDLGERIAAVTSHAAADPGMRTALADLQDALGLQGPEATRSRVGAPAPDELPTAEAAPVTADAINRYIDADHRDLRLKLLARLSADDFAYVDARDTAAYRTRVLEWCNALAAEDYGGIAYPAEFGGSDDVAASIAAFETLAYHDLSLLIKYGVHFGLFGGAVFQLGTRSHHERYMRDMISLDLPGCFAMTETGHGSNVREIRTTASYDVASHEFVIHTPSPDARKDYIGNAALHGRMAVVFAQLDTPTGAHGVHAFLVPIRDDDGNPLPGIQLEDCGVKVGLNGVDNGRITFDSVRVPRENLLDRFGSVSEGGAYTSPIASPGRRFFTMIGTLVAGRISIACASLSAAKSGLAIATRYAAKRRQFGPEGAAEVPLLHYTTMQQRILPRIATAYALDFALKDLVRTFAARDESRTQEIETLAAALKAFASDWTADTLREAREVCGGQGYLAVNRIGRLRADTDVFTTFEGANHVLYQLVAKGRLTEYRAQFGELKIWNIARHLAANAASRVATLNPITSRKTDPEHLLDPDFHIDALRYREDRLLASLARRLKHRLDDGMDSFDALNECQDHALTLARAFAERWILEQFQAGVDACPDPVLRDEALRPLAALFGLASIDHAAAWFLAANYIEGAKATAIHSQVNELCLRLRPVAVTLTDGFGIPDALLAAPIAIS
ncbi:MAG TPA: acyl-CoA dehydrogenase [Longimicrobiales bacterium]|nr:acyl-CoA dehydrogenase [Longimicrobiales bacterium]